MRRPYAPRLLRRVEVALWVVGISLLGVALGATLYRWHYQTQQERAILAQMSAAPSALPAQQQRPGARAIAPAVTDTDGVEQSTERASEIAEPNVEPVPAAAANDAQSTSQQPRAKRAKKVTPETSAYGLIEIPSVGIRAIVKEGEDDRTLARAVGLIPGGARPGEPGNIIMAGHRDTFFRPLRNIEKDDRIRVVVPPNEYEYRVDRIEIVGPEQTSVLESRGVEELTLVTCFPFRFLGPAPDRFVVTATRVN